MTRANPWLSRLETVGLLALLLLILVGALYIRATVAREAIEAITLIAILGVMRWHPSRPAPRPEAEEIARQINVIVERAWQDETVTMDGGK